MKEPESSNCEYSPDSPSGSGAGNNGKDRRNRRKKGCSEDPLNPHNWNHDKTIPGSELSDLSVATRIDDKILDALHSRPIRFIIMITPRSELSGQIIANRVAVKILDGLHSRPVGDTIMGTQIVVAGKIEVAGMSMVEQNYLHGIVRNVKVISLPKRARNGASTCPGRWMNCSSQSSAVFSSSLSRYRSTCHPSTRSFTSVKTASGSPRSSNQTASPWSPIPLLLPAPPSLSPPSISLSTTST